MVVAAVLFGTSGTARELGPDSASSSTVGAARAAIGSIVLWAVVFGTRRRVPLATPVVLRPLGPLLAIGGLGVALYTPLFFVAVDRTGVAVGTVVAIAGGPFFAAGLDWRFRGVRPTGAWLRGTLVTVLGVIVLIAAVAAAVDSGGGAGGADGSGGAGGAAVDLVGIGAALAAGFGYATYSVTSKAAMERGLESTIALAISFTIGAVIVLGLSIRESWSWLANSGGVAMALYLGVVATGAAYVLFGRGLRRLTSATSVTLVLAEPLAATLLAAIVLDESIPLVGWLGVALVLVGLVLVGRGGTARGRSDGRRSGRSNGRRGRRSNGRRGRRSNGRFDGRPDGGADCGSGSVQPSG